MVASESQNQAKLWCSCQQKAQSCTAAVQQKLHRLGHVQHCALPARVAGHSSVLLLPRWITMGSGLHSLYYL